MKKIKILLVIFTLFLSNLIIAKEATCEAGGEGAISCAIEKTFSLDTPAGGGTTTVKYEITCAEGFYACCNFNMITGNGAANCVNYSNIPTPN